MSDEKIRAAIKVECDRQHVGENEQRSLYFAYFFLKDAESRLKDLPEWFLLHLAQIIEPSNKGQYRTTPVTFGHVLGGGNPSLISTVMPSWIEFFNVTLGYMEIGFQRDVTIDAVIKEFLDIHPFSDGNGRTAWLLRVWLLNQWDDPQPLPDYYGETK